jgi:hypothetical protein
VTHNVLRQPKDAVGKRDTDICFACCNGINCNRNACRDMRQSKYINIGFPITAKNILTNSRFAFINRVRYHFTKYNSGITEVHFIFNNI